MDARRRILVSTEPRLLGDAIAHVLRDVDLDDVVVDMPGLATSHYDAAIVSVPHGELEAELVIELGDGPPQNPSSGSTCSAPIHPVNLFQVLEVLDLCCRAPVSRTARLATLLPPSQSTPLPHLPGATDGSPP